MNLLVRRCPPVGRRRANDDDILKIGSVQSFLYLDLEVVKRIVPLSADQKAGCPILLEAPPHHFRRKPGLPDAGRPHDKIRRRGRPQAQQRSLFGLIKVFESLLGLCLFGNGFAG